MLILGLTLGFISAVNAASAEESATESTQVVTEVATEVATEVSTEVPTDDQPSVSLSSEESGEGATESLPPTETETVVATETSVASETSAATETEVTTETATGTEQTEETPTEPASTPLVINGFDVDCQGVVTGSFSGDLRDDAHVTLNGDGGAFIGNEPIARHASANSFTIDFNVGPGEYDALYANAYPSNRAGQVEIAHDQISGCQDDTTPEAPNLSTDQVASLFIERCTGRAGVTFKEDTIFPEGSFVMRAVGFAADDSASEVLDEVQVPMHNGQFVYIVTFDTSRFGEWDVIGMNVEYGDNYQLYHGTRATDTCSEPEPNPASVSIVSADCDGNVVVAISEGEFGDTLHISVEDQDGREVGHVDLARTEAVTYSHSFELTDESDTYTFRADNGGDIAAAPVSVTGCAEDGGSANPDQPDWFVDWLVKAIIRILKEVLSGMTGSLAPTSAL